MDRQQAKHDGRDNRRAFRWGIVAVVVLVVLALGYNVLSTRRDATPTTQPSTPPGTPASPATPAAPKPPGQ